MFIAIGFIKYLSLLLIIALPLLIAIAYFTLAERKVIAAIQRRRGPAVLGFFGLLQPLADGFKLILKELVFPTKINKLLFLLAPILSFFLSFLGWVLIPFRLGYISSDISLGLLFITLISTLNVYSILLSGWASASRYSLLGSLRAIAQMLAYDIYFVLALIPIIMLTGSINLTDIVLTQQNNWNIWPFWPLFFIFFVTTLVETNRAPFDLPEAEAEIVAGYNLEYSGIIFALFFLAEYNNMLLMSALAIILFFGGWLRPFSTDFFEGQLEFSEATNFLIPEFIFAIKIVLYAMCFIYVRAALPRYRFDQLMEIGWKVFLPLTISFIFFWAGLILYCDFSNFILLKNHYYLYDCFYNVFLMVDYLNKINDTSSYIEYYIVFDSLFGNSTASA